MKRERVGLHALRFNRSDRMLWKSVWMARKQGANVGALTETYERRHVLDRMANIAHHSVGDISIWWDTRHKKSIYRSRIQLTGFITERGRVVPSIDMPVVALEDRTSLEVTCYIGVHLPRGIEESWGEDTGWNRAAERTLDGLTREARVLSGIWPKAVIVILGDWNLDLNLQKNRKRIKERLGHRWDLGRVYQPTLGSRRTEGAAVLRGHISGMKVTRTRRISDHDFALVTIASNGGRMGGTIEEA